MPGEVPSIDSPRVPIDPAVPKPDASFFAKPARHACITSLNKFNHVSYAKVDFTAI